jgi:hypothetical protein
MVIPLLSMFSYIRLYLWCINCSILLESLLFYFRFNSLACPSMRATVSEDVYSTYCTMIWLSWPLVDYFRYVFFHVLFIYIISLFHITLFFVVSVLLIVLYSFLYCSTMCLYVLNPVLWFPHTNYVRFVFTSSCL